MFSDVGVHSWPIITKKNSFFCFIDSVVTCEKVSMGVVENIVDERLGQKNDDTAWFKLTLNSSPDYVIFNKAIICKISYNVLTFLISWELPV